MLGFGFSESIAGWFSGTPVGDQFAALLGTFSLRPSGYLVLAEHLWHAREIAGAWNFGPGEIDSRSVAWIVERIADLWDDGLRWERDTDQHPHEANILKLDSTLARTRLAWTPAWDLEQGVAATVNWYGAYKAGEDMHRFSLEQIGAYQAANSNR